jgi:SAM-dependent methyltransferase
VAYEQHLAYLKVFDREQAPIMLRTLAQRADVPLQPMAGGMYLDLGCAAGHSTLALAPLYPDVEFIGIDFNANHIADATAEAQRLSLANCRYIQADFRALPSQLPPADLLMVRGIYSWLSPEVKMALEEALARLAAPAALLRLHYSTLPGGVLRDGLGEVFRALGAAGLSATRGRAITRLLEEQAPILHRHLATAAQDLTHQRQQSDELWVHDLLNEDFHAEYARTVLERLAAGGYRFAASTEMARNLPTLLVNSPILPLLADWHAPATQTLLDVVTFSGGRTDLLVRGTRPDFAAGSYSPATRFGVIVPSGDLFLPVPTVNGTLRYENAGLRALLEALNQRPATVAALAAAFPQLSATGLRDGLDLLWAGGKIAPFLPVDQVPLIDRERLRRINRERLRAAVANLSPQTKIPLLAAEMGNCLEAGWFESLVLAHFADRHKPAVQQRLLQRSHAARISFRGADGQADPNQLSALQRELGRLEATYIPRMAYWGIEV